jgi:hypothetical protein
VELFTITCTTCRQRLKVGDASTIGEIQICPKCGSMVLVEPPTGWSGPPAAEPPPAAPPDLDARPGEVDTSPLRSASPQRAATYPPEPVGDSDAGVVAAAAPPFVEPPLAPGMDGELIPSEPVLPTEDWTSQAARQRQQWLMLGGAAVVGVVLALGLVGFLASRVANQTRDEAAQPGVAPEAPTSDAASPPQQALSEPAAPAGEPGTETAAVPSHPAADDPGTSAAAAAEPVAAAASTPQAAPAESAPPDGLVTEDLKPEAMPAASPHSQQPTAPPETVAATQPKEPNLDPGALSETLKAFAPFIDPDVEPAPPEPMNAAEQGLPELDPQTVTTQQPSVPRPEPRTVDVPARLQDKIAEVEFADVPLKNFLRFIMNFSTIPVSVDPDALALVRATPRSKINVQKADATVDQLLTAALSPLQLAPLSVDQQLVVTRPPLADGGLRRHAHGVSDLIGNDPQTLTQLADLIVELVEPSSWESAGGAGVIHEDLPSLVIQQRETVLFRAIVFCDRLRAARGLPPQSKFDPELFSLAPRLARAAPRLAKPVTLNFPQPASFTRVLDRLSDAGEVEILVDWQALVPLGWTPDTETTVTANQRPIGEVLTEMLQPMELTYRVIDAASVQVTSPAAAEARWDIEFYPVPESLAAGPTADALVTRIRNELTGGNPDKLAGALHFDAPSRHLIAALPQSQQRKLAALLTSGGQEP